MKSCVVVTALVGCALAFGEDPPKAGKPEIFPLKDVKAGMQATAWTVFKGTTAEAMPVEIVGCGKTSWAAPGRDPLQGGGRDGPSWAGSCGVDRAGTPAEAVGCILPHGREAKMEIPTYAPKARFGSCHGPAGQWRPALGGKFWRSFRSFDAFGSKPGNLQSMLTD